ncbi:MAG: ABC transporter permease [Deltaproteobacteria bacterium]|nr:ABC transporter permease [Deltaproteobacteria bacterium]
MRLLVGIALKHLLFRKRQSLVSLLGIVLGVAFFLAIAALMQGSEKDFITRLVDNAPHITMSDEYRTPRKQPVEEVFPRAALELRNVQPLTETRGIRGYEQILSDLHRTPGTRAAAVLTGQALVSYAGRDFSVVLNGMNPEEIKGITTIENYMKQGSIDDLIIDPDGIVIGTELAKRLSLQMGDNITIVASTGQVRTFKILGLFRTGRSDYDERQTYVSLKRVQALLNRPNRANSIIIKLDDPNDAYQVAEQLEERYLYKSVSWQEASEDLLSTLTIRNIIMYTVVSTVLIVAAFGIYNVISTVVMEKHRDIAILKSMGFHGRDVQRIFLGEGLILGLLGCVMGIPLGAAIMAGLMQIRFNPPGASEPVNMPMDWSWPQFAIAAAFAIGAATVASLLPARKAARVKPVDILRGGT